MTGIELALIAMAGFLGSAHCAGMCGPIVLALGAAAPSTRVNLCRQGLFSIGRLFTYGFLGACAGFAGMTVRHSSQQWIDIARILSITAGLALVVQGLSSADIFPQLTWRRWWRGSSCLGTTFFASYLRSPQQGFAFLAGLMAGFLPCGLVYSFLMLAASSLDLLRGAATMAAFGVGTLPVMVLIGGSGSLVNLTWRTRLNRWAAWAMVAVGIMSISRGWSWGTGSCPYCAP